MQIAFEHRAMGNLPEVALSKFGNLYADNTNSGRGKRRMVLYVRQNHEDECNAVKTALHLHNQGTIECEMPLPAPVPNPG